MLVLTRKIGESIHINDDIVVSVVEVSRGKVRIGVEAPGDVSILRSEIYSRIREENIESSASTTETLTDAVKLLKRKIQPRK